MRLTKEMIGLFYNELNVFGVVGASWWGKCSVVVGLCEVMEMLLVKGLCKKDLALAEYWAAQVGSRFGKGFGCIAAMVLFRVPFQYKCGLDEIWSLFEGVEEDVGELRHLNRPFNRVLLKLAVKEDKHVFPIKDMPEALIKSNVRVSDILLDMEKYKNEAYKVFTEEFGFLAFEFNDHVGSLLIWFSITYYVHKDLSRLVVRCHDNLEVLKSLSNVIKSLGVLGGEGLNEFVELQTLSGRGSNRLDFEADVAFRVDKKVFDETKDACVDRERLKDAIRRVKNEEFKGKPEWPGKDEFWAKRWLWCKSGSHSKSIEEEVLGHKIPGERPNRRMFVEECPVNLIAHGDAKVYVGMSEKMELDKGRSIYNCDTRSYCTFEYLLAPVEKVWAGRYVDIDPGNKQDAVRFKQLGRAPGTHHVMLDYEDFNSHHSLDSQKLVFEVMCEGADAGVLDWALKSFDNMYVKTPGSEERQKLEGTLASGHRGTTFINSVLNRAYLLATLEPSLFNCFFMKHVGDDIYMKCMSAGPVNELFEQLSKTKLRMKRTKQGVGVVNGEFLRCSFNEKAGIGYLARSIGAFVCGNWTSERLLSGDEIIMMYPQAAWAMNNRAGVDTAGLCLVSSLVRRLKGAISRDSAELVVTSKCSLNGGPCRTIDGWTTLRLKVGVVKREYGRKVKEYGGMQGLATKDYLNHFVDEETLGELKLTKNDLKGPMLAASYGLELEERVLYTAVLSTGTFNAEFFNSNDVKFEKRRSLLASYTSLNFVKNLLRTDDLVRFCREHSIPHIENAFAGGYGRYRVLVGTHDRITFSDISQLGYVFCNHTFVACDYQMRM